MNELKKEFEKNRYKNVITCLNSGNIIFESLDNESTISKDINLIIKNKFNIDIPIYIIKISELKELVDNKPNWFTLNDKNTYNNIIFIIPPHTYQEIYNVLGKPNELLEQIHEYKKNRFTDLKICEPVLFISYSLILRIHTILRQWIIKLTQELLLKLRHLYADRSLRFLCNHRYVLHT